MKFLIIDTYYPLFLNNFYGRHRDLLSYPYAEQWRSLMDQCFGTADFYSSNLKKLGYEATEVIANCEPLQKQWAKENGIPLEEPTYRWTIEKRASFIRWPKRIQFKEWFYRILGAQVNHYHPDVLYIQDMNSINEVFLREMRSYVRLTIGQIACPISPGVDFSEYDLIVSSFPHFVDRFRSEGLTSEYFKLGFEPRVLEYLNKKEEAHHQVVFVGGLSANHAERIRFLEKIVTSHRLDLWGYGIDSVNPESLLHSYYHGEAWGLRMYKLLYRTDISLNHHINVSGHFANNMRLYEATGVGTFLITDYKDNLKALFEPGKEVVAYRSADECVELITYYLTHENERKAISRAGQKRTFEEHTFYHRMQELLEIIKKYL